MRKNVVPAVLVVIAVTAVAALNYALLLEAYGSGPPHYGLTTNMDKWSDPTVFLLTLDAATLVALALMWRRFMRR